MASLSRTATACGAITVRIWANLNVSASFTRVAVAVMTLKHGGGHPETTGSGLSEM